MAIFAILTASLNLMNSSSSWSCLFRIRHMSSVVWISFFGILHLFLEVVLLNYQYFRDGRLHFRSVLQDRSYT